MGNTTDTSTAPAPQKGAAARVLEYMPGDGRYIRVSSVRRDEPYNYYSTAAAVWEPTARRSALARAQAGTGWDMITTDPEYMLALDPGLAVVLAVHNAAHDGTPMHAVANGWYFYTGEATEYEVRHYGTRYAYQWGTPHERAAAALRVAPDALPTGMGKDEFVAYAAALAPAWAAAAAAADDYLAEGTAPVVA